MPGMMVVRGLRRNTNTTRIDQKDGQHERALDVLHRGADGGRAVDGGVEIDRGGEQCAKFRQQRLYAVDRLDDVGACLAEHLQLDRRLAVREPGDADVLDRVPDASEIGEPYGRAVTVRHDQRLVVGRLHQLIRRADLERRRCVGHLTFGTVRIRGAQHRSNLIEAEVVLRQRARVELDPHCRECTTSHVDLTDAFDLRQPLRYD